MAEAPPPDLPGYEYERELGSGGFADVHLYRQRLPSRQVAVKVLRQTASSPADREQFENEANRMAMLSSHPSIVTIYEVGVSPDSRPYLTMEYCPNDHFGRIARAHPLTVTRALEVGIKVASAVETAHRASILHRDVKPANVLLTTYGEPALTDFGIAGGGIEGAGDELAVSQGVSIPFAAPEVLSGATVGDERSDVYSLAATVYALLAGRAPFSTGEPQSEAQLISRVLSSPLAPTGRHDVPPTLERVLAGAMDRNPDNRYQSAAEFGRALQGTEAELGLSQTALRVAASPSSSSGSTIAPATTGETGAPASSGSGAGGVGQPGVRAGSGHDSDPDPDSTRFTAVQRVDPTGSRRATAPPAPDVDRPVGWDVDRPGPLPDGALGDRTVQRRGDNEVEPAAGDPGSPTATGRQTAGLRRNIVLGAAAMVLLVAVAFVLSKSGGDVDDGSTSTTTRPSGEGLVVAGVPPRPERVRVDRTDGGSQAVTWTVPSPQEGDTFQLFFTEGPGDLVGTAETTEQMELRVATERRICVTIETIRGGRVSEASTQVCSP